MNELSRLALKIVVGAREQGTGNREQGTGNRKRVLGDFTFLHIPLNFSVHLLRKHIYIINDNVEN
jgi:hypothetical protein